MKYFEAETYEQLEILKEQSYPYIQVAQNPQFFIA